MRKFLGNKRNIILIILIILAIAFSTIVFAKTRKENIQNATIKDLDSVNEIGCKLSGEIYYYVKTYNVRSVDELEECINYLGDKRIKELKKKYK